MIQILNDEGVSSSLEEFIPTSSTKSCEDKSTLVISFERTILVVEQSSENSTSNEGTSQYYKIDFSSH